MSAADSRISTTTRLLGVAGWPVEHSLSPRFQNAALRAAGVDAVYLAFPIAPGDFGTAVRGLAAAGALGLNCTVPHKGAAYAVCDALSDAARAVGAVNTLHFRPDGIFGDNTDVEGYVESLRHDAGFDPAGCAAVQLGGGGAGRATAWAVLCARAARLTLVNRTLERAEALVAALRSDFPDATLAALSPESDAEAVREALASADLVSNVTTLGLKPSDPFPCAVEDLPREALIFDAAYRGEGPTAWLGAAAERGCPTLDGLGMLVRQGAASLRIWLAIEPDIEIMFAALREG